MWPTEAFGGLSDDQFWDDLASDKPLTTTARTATKTPGPGTGHGAADRADGHSRRTAPEAGNAPRYRAPVARSAARPSSRPGHPAVSAASPQVLLRPPSRCRACAASSGARAPADADRYWANQTRPRAGHAEADEDPLTSTAFSLRASDLWTGGRTRFQRATRASWDQYNAPFRRKQKHRPQNGRCSPPDRKLVSRGSADPYSGTSAYLYPVGHPATGGPTVRAVLTKGTRRVASRPPAPSRCRRRTARPRATLRQCSRR